MRWRTRCSKAGKHPLIFGLVSCPLRCALERWGAVDVQVYNAGILSQRPFFELPVEEWDRVFAVNARGTLPVRPDGGPPHA